MCSLEELHRTLRDRVFGVVCFLEFIVWTKCHFRKGHDYRGKSQNQPTGAMKKTLHSNVKVINQHHLLGYFFIHITTLIVIIIVVAAAAAGADVVNAGGCTEYIYRIFIMLFTTS